MTGYTVHTGSTVKFSTGWDKIFGGTPGGRATKKATGKKDKKKKAQRRATHRAR